MSLSLLSGRTLLITTDIRTAIFVNTTKNMLAQDIIEERHPFGGAGTAKDVAKFALALASEDAQWLTGQCIAVDGGYTAQ